MAYEFRDMATVDLVEEVSDTANVLIEEDGKIKRAPKSQVGGNDYITIHSTIRYVENENEYYYTVEQLSPEAYGIVLNAFENDLPVNVYIVEHYINEYADGSNDNYTNKTLSYYVGITEDSDEIHLSGYVYYYTLYPDGTVEID